MLSAKLSKFYACCSSLSQSMKYGLQRTKRNTVLFKHRPVHRAHQSHRLLHPSWGVLAAAHAVAHP